MIIINYGYKVVVMERKLMVAWMSGSRWSSSGRRGTVEVVEAHNGVA
jgi:hypothetical protein